MNFQEAWIHMDMGRRVRLRDWTGYWMIRQGHGVLVDETGQYPQLTSEHLTSQNWEVAVEPEGRPYPWVSIKKKRRFAWLPVTSMGCRLSVMNPKDRVIWLRSYEEIQEGMQVPSPMRGGSDMLWTTTCIKPVY